MRPATDKHQAPTYRLKLNIRAYIESEKFNPNFSVIVAPLIDLTRKGPPNLVKWTLEQDNAVVAFKKALTVSPILKLPAFNQTFIFRIDGLLEV